MLPEFHGTGSTADQHEHPQALAASMLLPAGPDLHYNITLPLALPAVGSEAGDGKSLQSYRPTTEALQTPLFSM